jgi:hypothetical protein
MQADRPQPLVDRTLLRAAPDGFEIPQGLLDGQLPALEAAEDL